MELYPLRERKFIKTFQRHTGLNLEHRNLLISTLFGNLLTDIKKQTEIKLDEWVSPLTSLMLQPPQTKISDFQSSHLVHQEQKMRLFLMPYKLKLDDLT